ALGKITTGTDWAVGLLIEAIDDNGLGVTEAAIAALGDVGPAAKDATPRLVKVWNDDSKPKHQVYAAANLALIDPIFTDLAVKFLTESLHHKESQVRHNAVHMLARLGPAAKRALPSLRELLKEKDEVLRDLAADAIRVISAPPVVAQPDKNLLRFQARALDRR